MKTVTLANDLNLIGYGVLPKGLKLKVKSFNTRYIYAELNNNLVKLTYKDITAKSPKRKQVESKVIKDKSINDFLSGENVSFL